MRLVSGASSIAGQSDYSAYVSGRIRCRRSAPPPLHEVVFPFDSFSLPFRILQDKESQALAATHENYKAIGMLSQRILCSWPEWPRSIYCPSVGQS